VTGRVPSVMKQLFSKLALTLHTQSERVRRSGTRETVAGHGECRP
jgi:hypothetical protein